MVHLSSHGPVVRAEFATARTRLIGITVSCYAYRGVVIDTAVPDARQEYRGWLGDLRPDGVVVTHQHEDHAGNVNSVAKLGLPLWMGDETAAAVRDVQPIGYYRQFTWKPMRSLTRAVTEFEPGPVEMLHTPGHSSDHHVAWAAEERILFAGDLFLGVKVRVAHPYENPRHLVESLRRMAALEPRMMFCAHRGLVANPTAALTAKADWLAHTIGEVDRLLDAGWADAAIRRAVLGREDVAGYISFGDYSRTNFVTAIRGSRLLAVAAEPARKEA